MYINFGEWSVRPQHVAGIHETNKICWGGRQQLVCQFEYDIPQWDEYYKKKYLLRKDPAPCSYLVCLYIRKLIFTLVSLS